MFINCPWHELDDSGDEQTKTYYILANREKTGKILLLYESVIPLYRNSRIFPFQRHKDLMGDIKKASKYAVKGIQDS
jgi:hypothetical protein